MSVEVINRKRYKCRCDLPDCGHPWEADSIPDRCAKCKRATWNRPHLRAGRNGKQITAFGKTQTISEWGREKNISGATISSRIRHGWTVEDAISTPVWKEGMANG